MQSLRFLLNILFPEQCLSCTREGSPLCEDCLSSVPMAKPTPYPWCYARFDYHNKIMKDALWNLKYKNRKGVATSLGKSLHELIFEEYAEKILFGSTRKILVIPIPLSRRKLRERGYNQCDLLARALVKEAPDNYVYAPKILIKHKDTASQAKITSKKERLQNIRGSFSIRDAKLVHKQRCILIDDIVTTGATLTEARRILLSAGASDVCALTVAH